LHHLELAVLALATMYSADQLAVGDLLGDGLHDRVVGPDGIGRDDVEVGEGQSLRAGFAARDEHFLVVGGRGRGGRGGRGHYRHVILLLALLARGVLAGDARGDLGAALLHSCLISSSYWPRKRKP
jgi:hypothetical protein